MQITSLLRPLDGEGATQILLMGHRRLHITGMVIFDHFLDSCFGYKLMIFLSIVGLNCGCYPVQIIEAGGRTIVSECRASEGMCSQTLLHCPLLLFCMSAMFYADLEEQVQAGVGVDIYVLKHA